MGGDAFSTVMPDQPLEIPARLWNEVIALVNRSRSNELGNQAEGLLSSTAKVDIITLKNGSGSDVSRFDVLGLSTPLFTPNDNLVEFQQRAMMVGVTPDIDDHVGKFAVLLEPLADGSIGKAAVGGVIPAVINVTDADHTHADIKDAAVVLESGTTGLCEILWKETGTGTKHAIVRIGTPPSISTLWGKLKSRSGNVYTFDQVVPSITGTGDSRVVSWTDSGISDGEAVEANGIDLSPWDYDAGTPVWLDIYVQLIKVGSLYTFTFPLLPSQADHQVFIVDHTNGKMGFDYPRIHS